MSSGHSLASKARFGSILGPLWVDFGVILVEKQPLGQIVPKETSGTNCFQNNLSGTNRSQNNLSEAIRYMPYTACYALYAICYML